MLYQPFLHPLTQQPAVTNLADAWSAPHSPHAVRRRALRHDVMIALPMHAPFIREFLVPVIRHEGTMLDVRELGQI